MLSKLDNCGPFHFFYTLSCADMRWPENFICILRVKGLTIAWDCGQSSMEDTVEPEIKVQFADGTFKPMSEFLETEADESIHEYIRNNVFTATRNFVHRVNSFRREIMMG